MATSTSRSASSRFAAPSASLGRRVRAAHPHAVAHCGSPHAWITRTTCPAPTATTEPSARHTLTVFEWRWNRGGAPASSGHLEAPPRPRVAPLFPPSPAGARPSAASSDAVRRCLAPAMTVAATGTRAAAEAGWSDAASATEVGRNGTPARRPSPRWLPHRGTSPCPLHSRHGCDRPAEQRHRGRQQAQCRPTRPLQMAAAPAPRACPRSPSAPPRVCCRCRRLPSAVPSAVAR